MMISKEIWIQIWNLQGDLNKLVGRNTLAKQNKRVWLNEYLDQADNEAFEAKNCFYHKWWVEEVKSGKYQLYELFDPENLKIELIDMLHFLVSAFQCMEDRKFFLQTLALANEWNVMNTYNPYDLLNRFIKETNILKKTGHLLMLFMITKMPEIEILKIYQMKHKANVERQRNGYSWKGKNEKDNDEIKARLKNSEVGKKKTSSGSVDKNKSGGIEKTKTLGKRS